MTTPTDMHKVHHGRNIRRFREMLGLKQEALAAELGGDWTQRRISLLEGKELVEDDILKEVAGALKVPKEAIENFDEEQAVNVIASTFNDNAQVGAVINNYNPVDTVLKLHDEKMALYERMLKEKDEMMLRLQKLIEMK